MKKIVIPAAIFTLALFLVSYCADSGSNPAPAAPESQQAQDVLSDEETFDYTAYEDVEVEEYKDFDSVPLELRDEVNEQAVNFVRVMEKIRDYEPQSKGILSTLRMGMCMVLHCWRPMIACVINGECRSQLMGLGDCMSSGDEDAQMLCFIQSLSSPCDKMIDMMSCWGESGCMPPAESDCPLPANREQIAPVTLADLEGDWYVVRGLSPIYDCWNCQKYTFTQTGPNTSSYIYTYFPGEDGAKSTIECTTTAIPFSPDETEIFPGRFRVDYSAYGMPGTDNWFCLSHPNSNYVLIYYCGASSMHAYQGGIVLSRTLSTDIPADVMNAFSDALANAGLESPLTMEDFCTPDNSGCSF